MPEGDERHRSGGNGGPVPGLWNLTQWQRRQRVFWPGQTETNMPSRMEKGRWKLGLERQLQGEAEHFLLVA